MTVRQTSEGVTITSSGRLSAPLDLVMRQCVVRYDAEGLANDAEAIVALAKAEQLAGHAASVHARSAD